MRRRIRIRDAYRAAFDKKWDSETGAGLSCVQIVVLRRRSDWYHVQAAGNIALDAFRRPNIAVPSISYGPSVRRYYLAAIRNFRAYALGFTGLADRSFRFTAILEEE